MQKISYQIILEIQLNNYIQKYSQIVDCMEKQNVITHQPIKKLKQSYFPYKTAPTIQNKSQKNKLIHSPKSQIIDLTLKKCFLTPKLQKILMKFQEADMNKNYEGTQYDNICPNCGKVIENDRALIYNCKQLRRKFMWHANCMINKGLTNENFLLVEGQIQQGIIQEEVEMFKFRQVNNMQDHEYFGEIIISHPISNLVYLRNRGVLFFQQNELFWNFLNQESEMDKQNKIFFPYTDLKIKVIIEYKSNGKSQRKIKQFTFFINLNRRKSKKKKIVVILTSHIKLQLTVYQTQKQIKQLKRNQTFMNRQQKIKHLFRLNYLQINLPDEFQQELSNKSTTTSSTDNKFFDLTFGSGQKNQIKKNKSDNIDHRTMNFNIQKANLVQNICQSAEMAQQMKQNIKKCDKLQLSKIFGIISQKFQIVSTDMNGSIFLQQIMMVWNFFQKYQILSRIGSKIVDIIKNNVGANSIIAFLYSLQEDYLQLYFSELISNYFEKLSDNMNGSIIIEQMILKYREGNIKKIYQKIKLNYLTLIKCKYSFNILKLYVEKRSIKQIPIQNVILNIQSLVQYQSTYKILILFLQKYPFQQLIQFYIKKILHHIQLNIIDQNLISILIIFINKLAEKDYQKFIQVCSCFSLYMNKPSRQSIKNRNITQLSPQINIQQCSEFQLLKLLTQLNCYCS